MAKKRKFKKKTKSYVKHQRGKKPHKRKRLLKKKHNYGKESNGRRYKKNNYRFFKTVSNQSDVIDSERYRNVGNRYKQYRSIATFAENMRKINICRRRYQRRLTLFRSGKIGRGKHVITPKTYTLKSKVRC